MRRTGITSKTPPAAPMSATSTAPSAAGYTALPTSARAAPAKPRPSSAPVLFLAAVVAVLLFLATFADMPLADRLKAVFSGAPRAQHPPTSAMSPAAVAALNGFGLGLFARLAAADTASDVVVSPLSVATALRMALMGATKGSEAERELLAVVGDVGDRVPGHRGGGVEFVVANSAWVTGMVKEAYKDGVRRIGAQVEQMPSDVAPVNAWVKKQTGGKIEKLLDEIPTDVVAFLLNAVYYKASWKIEFEEAKTAEKAWFADGGRDTEVKKVRMMRMTKQSFPYAEVDMPGSGGEKVQVMELPYAGEEYGGVVIVPQGRAKVGDVIRLFEGGSKIWDTWTGQMVNQTLDAVGMPRFKMEYGVQSLKGELQGMGVRAAFVSNKEKPPFWELSEDPETYMDDVLHKATIECTEKGTVASAATAVVLMTRSMPRKNPEVWMDRPFVFAVRNRNSGALLFLARVDDPMSP